MKEAIGITITEAFRKLKVPSKHVENTTSTSLGDVKNPHAALLPAGLRENTHFLG